MDITHILTRGMIINLKLYLFSARWVPRYVRTDVTTALAIPKDSPDDILNSKRGIYDDALIVHYGGVLAVSDW